MSKLDDVIKINTETINDKDINRLADEVGAVILAARKESANILNGVIVKSYWAVGEYIVKFEQKGNAKAKYGTTLLTKLSKILTVKFGKGFSRPNLNCMRKFYLLYPNLSDMSDKLTWSHICEIIKIDDQLERKFYENQCVKENWNVRSLRRQMDSGLYLRLAASKDKKGIIDLANKGIVIQTPEDGVKDTYTLEFLGLPEKERYSEKDLENKIIDNLQTFLLELGKGFTFEKRQYPLTINNIHYHVDLVFLPSNFKMFCFNRFKKEFCET